MRDGETTVLITGSSGLVGPAIASARSASGWRIRGLDRLPGPWTNMIADLRDAAAVREALHEPHVGLASESDF